MSTNLPPSVAAVLDKADCSGAVSEEFISEVERRNELALPDEYRAFLLRYGAALLQGLEVYGLVPSAVEGEPPCWNDVRALLRNSGLPSHLVPISDDGCDFSFYLSSSWSELRTAAFPN
ncbi:SMI1/KNR4 family protein [Variovorax sp. LjRoot178]|uniref:SMI1/KNR4 family protein n=1 Tax=Variovorax sp. LjRoot178 TaxID=3342277 RepID=UPI003ECD13F0